jgi:hypothetical protein
MRGRSFVLKFGRYKAKRYRLAKAHRLKSVPPKRVHATKSGERRVVDLYYCRAMGTKL